MIEKIIPVEIPPGIVKNGTLYQRANRWSDGNLVRFVDGRPRALGAAFSLSFTPSAPNTGRPLGAFSYLNSSLHGCVVYGSQVGGTTKVYHLTEQTLGTVASVSDITPASPNGAGSFQADYINGKIVFCFKGGSIFESTGPGVAGTDTGAPSASTLVVTPERFLVSATDFKVSWASQGTTTTWTPSSTNSAGSLDLIGAGRIVSARVVRGQTLIWTSDGLWGLNYVGAPLYYGATLLGKGCGAIAARSVKVAANGMAFWMTERGFMSFDGYARPLRGDLDEYVFGDINGAMRDRIFAVANHPANEIWWFYPSSAATDTSGPDRMVIYNHKEDVWSLGTLSRSAGADAGYWSGTSVAASGATLPVLLDADGSHVYAHDADGVLSGAYIESGPLMLDPAGNDLVRVQKFVPDNNQTTAAENLTLYRGTWPKVAETNTVYSIPAAGGEMDVRDIARYVRFRQELTRSDSRIGTPRIGVLKDAKK